MDVGLAMTARVNPNERERPLTEVYRQIIDQAVPGKERFGRTYEALEVIRKCFAEDEFSHHGRYFDYDGVRMTTKPVQVISKHRNEDIEEMVIQFNHPGMAAEHVRSSMELFARELMPEVRGWGA